MVVGTPALAILILDLQPMHLSSDDRRTIPRAGATTDRRRTSWRDFRRSYPGVVATMGLALLVMLAVDGYMLYKRSGYAAEATRLRAEMTDVERRRTDLLLQSDENRMGVMVELIRRQASADKQLHLAVSVDSGRMTLQREGAKLREMRVQFGPERWVGTAPDTVRTAVPRGTRTVERVLSRGAGWEVPRWVFVDRGLPEPADRTVKGALGPRAIVLSGGTVIYSMPSAGPLNDSTYVMPGAVRARAEDLDAIAPNVRPGMTIYFY
jgi:hypothetical protein